MSNDNEIWKEIKGYENFYKISSFGNVYSIRSKKILKPCDDKEGYQQVILCVKFNKKTRKVHHLVMENFISIRPSEQHQCAHIDGNPKNNRIENLRWSTPKENNKDKRNHGTHGTKLKSEDVLWIRSNYKKSHKEHPTGASSYDLAKKFNVSNTAILRIVNLKSWGHL